MSRNQGQDKGDQSTEQVTFWSVVTSTLAAAFGVQSRRNRERDFEHGRPGAFIAAGAAFTLVFVLILVLVVYLVIGTVAS